MARVDLSGAQRRLGAVLALMLAAGACAPLDQTDASLAEVQAAYYRHPGPPKLTLFTMVNNDTGSGAHSSIMISGSQRVIFDPAGSVRLSSIPERNDVLYGITDHVADFYTRAHARRTYHVVVQEIEVPAQVAEMALQRALSNGSVAQSQCTLATSGLLAGLPGFEHIKRTWFPNRLADQLRAMPGVKTRELYEYDDDDKTLALRAYVPEGTSPSASTPSRSAPGS